MDSMSAERMGKAFANALRGGWSGCRVRQLGQRGGIGWAKQANDFLLDLGDLIEAKLGIRDDKDFPRFGVEIDAGDLAVGSRFGFDFFELALSLEHHREEITNVDFRRGIFADVAPEKMFGGLLGERFWRSRGWSFKLRTPKRKWRRRFGPGKVSRLAQIFPMIAVLREKKQGVKEVAILKRTATGSANMGATLNRPFGSEAHKE